MPLPPLQNYNSRIPKSVSLVVEKALSKDSNHRYSSALEFSEAFKQASANERDVNLSRTTIFTDLQRVIEPFAEKAPDNKVSIRNRLNNLMSSMLGTSRYNPVLYCRSGEYQNQTIPISMEGLRMGRSSQNHIVIREKSVSRMHAIVYISQDGAFVRDEDSSLGTLVNGQKIMEITRLRHGDIIQIGYAQIFEYREG